jgi:hypothetical protein
MSNREACQDLSPDLEHFGKAVGLHF